MKHSPHPLLQMPQARWSYRKLRRICWEVLWREFPQKNEWGSECQAEKWRENDGGSGDSVSANPHSNSYDDCNNVYWPLNYVRHWGTTRYYEYTDILNSSNNKRHLFNISSSYTLHKTFWLTEFPRYLCEVFAIIYPYRGYAVAQWICIHIMFKGNQRCALSGKVLI